MKTLAIIPARGGSKGLKNKNKLLLNNKPLISYTIEAAKRSAFIDKVVVSTDDPEIADIGEQYGAEVPFMRPNELASDTATSVDVINHALDFYKDMGISFVNIILLQPTSPLRNNKHIDEAFNIYIQNGLKPVVSVKESDTHPYIMKKISDGRLTEFVKKPENITRRQDFPPIYELNGAIYITRRDILEDGVIYKDQVLPYVMNKVSSVDIDDQIDFLLAEILIKKFGDVVNVQNR